MVEAICDRCGERKAHVGIWEDNIMCGRIDAICDDCYERGERHRFPAEPPYNEDGELLWHIRFVECPHCGNVHEVALGDNIGVCPFRSGNMELDTDDVCFEITDERIVEEGV